jgi:hypothetical protein
VTVEVYQRVRRAGEHSIRGPVTQHTFLNSIGSTPLTSGNEGIHVAATAVKSVTDSPDKQVRGEFPRDVVGAPELVATQIHLDQSSFINAENR